jgi:4-hydroxy-2-oxoheptanedioate aldolase
MTKRQSERFSNGDNTLVKKCREKGIGVLGPVVPPTKESIEKAVSEGYTMLILGNYMWHFKGSLKNMMDNAVNPFRNSR